MFQISIYYMFVKFMILLIAWNENFISELMRKSINKKIYICIKTKIMALKDEFINLIES
jgi:hypothetical protein